MFCTPHFVLYILQNAVLNTASLYLGAMAKTIIWVAYKKYDFISPYPIGWEIKDTDNPISSAGSFTG